MASSSQGEPLDQRDYEAVQVRMVISVITGLAVQVPKSYPG